MRVYQIKCPACGGNIEIDENRDSCFCSYCGTKVHVDDGTHRVEITKNINDHKTYAFLFPQRCFYPGRKQYERFLQEKCENFGITYFPCFLCRISSNGV